MAEHPPGSTADLRGSDDPEYAANLKRATLAASVGSALEYYDFALYSLASALIFGKIFFPGLGDAAGTVASLATLAIGFLARPLGGLFFGTLGDRLGRKWVLMITIALMGGASTLIGVLPTADQIGVWAPILLVFLRICQGFGAGAEQAGATVLMAEYSPTRRRGFYSALPFVGIMLGTLMASAVFVGLGQVPEEALLSWVWRIPFLASIFLIGVAVLIRLRLKESPTFVQLEKQDQVADHPLRRGVPQRRVRPCCAVSGCGWRRTAAPTSTRPWPSPTSASWVCRPPSARWPSPSVPCSGSSRSRSPARCPTSTAG